MPDFTVTLTAEREAAWKEILGVEAITVGLNVHVAEVADGHIVASVNAQLAAKSLEEKQALLAS